MNYRTLQSQNQQLKQELAQLQEHQRSLETIINQITSAKAFKLWQGFNKIKKLTKQAILDPRKILKVVKIFATQGPRGVIEKIKSQEVQREQVLTINQQYQLWLKKHYPSKKELERQRKESKKFKYRPKISIITPVYNTPEKFLRECIESVLNQTYDNWELCLADDASTKPYVRKVLEEYKKKDKRIKVVYRKKNGHISRASNSALKLATGEFIGLLDHDDILWPNALYEVVKLLNKKPQAQFIYSDEDKLDEDGKTHLDPFFKPDWSPDYLRSINYITHFAVIKRVVVEKVKGFRVGTEGAQDWDLFLRATYWLEKNVGHCHPLGKKNPIQHISTILYSWRKSSASTASEKYAEEVKDYAYRNQKKVLGDDLKRRGLRGEVLPTKYLGLWRVKYRIKGKPLVSIIIPTKNKYSYISKCLRSIVKKSTYKNYELIIVDTGSTDKRVFRLYKKIKKFHLKTKVLNWRKQFNFSAVCNFGAKESKGDYLLFLNNDTEVITLDWIESMLKHAQREEIGAVGVKLLYPDGRIQHAGIILGIRGGPIENGVAGHAQKLFWDSPMGLPLLNSKDMIRNFSAVTAACLMISKKKCLEVGGMDKKFRIAFNDVDFCLKLRKKGYLNVYTPYAKLYHHESISVGKPEWGNRDLNEFQKEISLMHKRWGGLLQNDPYYNPNLTLDRENFSLQI